MVQQWFSEPLTPHGAKPNTSVAETAEYQYRMGVNLRSRFRTGRSVGGSDLEDRLQHYRNFAKNLSTRIVEMQFFDCISSYILSAQASHRGGGDNHYMYLWMDICLLQLFRKRYGKLYDTHMGPLDVDKKGYLTYKEYEKWSINKYTPTHTEEKVWIWD